LDKKTKAIKIEFLDGENSIFQLILGFHLKLTQHTAAFIDKFFSFNECYRLIQKMLMNIMRLKSKMKVSKERKEANKVKSVRLKYKAAFMKLGLQKYLLRSELTEGMRLIQNLVKS
jgi:hypothetical protein